MIFCIGFDFLLHAFTFILPVFELCVRKRVPTAVALTRNMFSRLNEGGEAYIGNMAVENPSRWFMEQHLDWVLIHRTRDEMRAFAEEAAPTAEVSILEELSGVNPFLCVRRS